jgi:hypothetical protein
MPVAALAGFSNMYVFGDSLSDNGNLYGWTGAPNPVTGGVDPVTGLPTSDTPTPIPAVPFYAPGRFQNGPSYSELLWSGLQAAGHLPAAGNLTAAGLVAVGAACARSESSGRDQLRSRWRPFALPPL